MNIVNPVSSYASKIQNFHKAEKILTAFKEFLSIARSAGLNNLNELEDKNEDKDKYKNLIVTQKDIDELKKLIRVGSLNHKEKSFVEKILKAYELQKNNKMSLWEFMQAYQEIERTETFSKSELLFANPHNKKIVLELINQHAGDAKKLIELWTSSDAPSSHIDVSSEILEKLQRLINAPSIIPAKPLPCYTGDRPEGIKIKNVCDVEKIDQSYKKEIESKLKTNWQIDTFQSHLPFQIESFETLHGPLQNMAYSLSGHNIEDLRSAKIMTQVIHQPQLINRMKAQKHLTLLYPGGGSHLAPLNMLMEAINQKHLVSGKIIYSEIQKISEWKIMEYLKWMRDQNMIKNLSCVFEKKGDGHISSYTFLYQGKKIELVYETNQGQGKLWSSESRFAEADLIIVHDSMKEIAHTKPHLEKLISLSQKNKKSFFVLSEANLIPRNSQLLAHFKQIGKYLGYYGCTFTGSTNANPYNAYYLEQGLLKRSLNNAGGDRHYHENINFQKSKAALIEIIPVD